jgi:predicted ATPase
MAIKKIEIMNFKSFEHLKIDLGNFNVLIGANACGKSNFIQIFQFLRDISNNGLDNAISMQGGVGYLRNLNIGASKNLSLEVTSDQTYGVFISGSTQKELVGIDVDETIYKLAINFKKRGFGLEIVEDKLIQKGDINVRPFKGTKRREEKKLGRGEIIASKIKGKISVDVKVPEEVEIKKEDIFIPEMLRQQKLKPKTPLLETLETPFFMPPLFSNTAIYDFDPKLPKKATPITGKLDLEEDGSNLSIVLRKIIEDKDKKRKLFNLVKDLLPFIDDLDVEKFADKSLLFKLREKYFKKQYLPASLISDGTINITALIIALYFEENPLTIIEEPERNIHPYLISKVVSMMKDASEKKQVIVTTHNPEIVKYAELKNILLVSRNKEGFSIISQPSEKEELKIFLGNQIGIEDLYVQSLLEA